MLDGTSFQSYPDRRGYPRYTFDLASPELPCGAGWLANCLIELGIPAWKPWNIDDSAHWRDLGAGRFSYELAGSPWSRVLPALVDGREFKFRPGQAVRVHHVWPSAYPAADRSVFFVRDPRDALYSAWRRALASGTAAPGDDGFAAFCRSPFFHYPIARVDYLLVFLRVWRRSLAEHGGVVVRFEDYRADAVTTLANALAGLGVDADDADIARAVEASSVVRLQEAEQRMIEAGVVGTPLVRGEPPGEHARRLGARECAMLDAKFAEMAAWLGYPNALDSGEEAAASPDARVQAALLAAVRRAGVPVAERSWLADALAATSCGIRLLTAEAEQPDCTIAARSR
jgi:hypothetical protein